MAAEETTPIVTSLAAQLSDAIAAFLHASFDDVAKNLVTRLQAPEAKAAPKLEVKEIEPSPPPPPPPPEPEPEPESEPEPLFNVPYARNPDFVGRSSHLSQLFGMWKPGHKGRISVAGLGGIGKTELVVEFVYRIKDVSPTTPVYWFRPNDLLSSPSSPSKSSSVVSIQLDEWLDQSRGINCLLVVDPGDKFEDLLQTSVENGRVIDKLRLFPGTVIVLSRSLQHGSLLAGPHDVCQLDDLEVEASVDLLSGRLGIQAQASPIELQEVVDLMTNLPRAILQVAALINGTGMTISQFLHLYRQGDAMKLRLFGRLDPVSQPDHTFSIVGKGVIDIKAFRNEFSTASRILYKMYFLGGTSVPHDVFSSSDQLEMIIMMNLLRGHFVLVENPVNTYTLHPLVFLAMHRIIETERPETDEEDVKQEHIWFEEVVMAFSKFYPDASNEKRDWWRSCFSLLLGGYDLNGDSLRISVSKIHQKESAYFHRKGRYTDALKMALLAKNALPDPVPQEHLSVLQDQIMLLELLGKYREVQTSLQNYPPDEQQSTILWKKRMQARLEQAEGANRYDSAVDIFRQVKVSRETAANNSMQDMFQSIDDFGCVLMLKGKYHDAAIECRKALSERTTLLGTSHVDTLTSLHHFASVLKCDGKYEEALRYIQEAIRGREVVLGTDHPETLQSRIIKARILLYVAVAMSDYDQAETLLVDSANRLSGILSDSHPLLLACRSDRAQIMLARGKYEASEQMNRATLSAREKGPWAESSSHPDTLASMHLLAEVLRCKEGCRAADALSERALVERTDVLTNGTLTGSDFHPDQLTSLHHRAIVLSGLGQHQAALQKIDFALSGRRTVLGSDHPDVFLSMTWKGEIMRSQLTTYQTQRAQTLDVIEALHKQALEGLAWILGPEHQNTLLCMTNLALAKHERGTSGHTEAESLYRQVYRAYQRNLGELHPETLKSKSRLAEASRALSPSAHQESKKMWREACAGFAKIFGTDAYLTVAAYKGYEKFLKTYPEP
ncbi:Nephrocystin-3 [Lachnellula hyalina]|uniref:Nephrocystin-3 n=1 Tax=Lachnellula hyalina TaxID=1316788 RepID=A0A8H8R4K3_9HELO|nr:Nephrocystin-3 [Lachnellula hyalina]TVY27605.1 Nephrocystin-3 [Lachnellula hyalina]